MKLLEFIDLYELSVPIRPNTAEQYRVAARSLQRFLAAEIEPTALDATTVNHWLLWLAGRVQPITAKSQRTHLLVLWRAAYRLGHCENDPDHRRAPIRRVVAPLALPVAWTVDEVRRLLDVAHRLPGEYAAICLSRADWWQRAIRLAWETGLRTGDLLAATRANLQMGQLVITQSKTGAPKISPLSAALVDELPAAGRLLPWPYSKWHMAREFRVIVTHAGLVGSFKKLRKSSASSVELLHRAGATHLGHAPGSPIAARHYLDPIICRPKPPTPEIL